MSFRKYGGINHSATNNIVKSHFSTSDNQTISNTLGQINSKIVSNSHLDLNKNSLLNVNTIYFDDGTMQNTAYLGGVQSSISTPLTIDGLKSINGKIEVTYPLNVSSTTTLNNGLSVSSGKVTISDLVTIDKHIFLRNIKTDVPKLPIYPSIIFYDNTSISSADGMLWPKTYDDGLITGNVTGICNPNYIHGGEVSYVGIGTNTPQCILHVGGEFRIDNNDLEKITVFKVNRYGDIDMSGNIHMGGNKINSTSSSPISLFETSSNIRVGSTNGIVIINCTDPATATDGALVVKGGINTTKNVYISENDSDIDPLKNALYVAGGIGLHGNYLVSSTDQSFNLLTASSSINMAINTDTATVTINSSKPVTNTDGALIVNGGINTKENVYICGNKSDIVPVNNALYVTGGIGLHGNYLVSSTDQSFNLLTASSSINVGTDSGTVTINSTNATASGTTGGALIVNGGIRVAKKSYFDTSANVFITNTDNATATLGSLVVSGGVSISKNVYISGTASSKDSSSNALYVAGGIGLNGNYLVSSSLDSSFNLLTASPSINIGTSTNTGTVTINSTKPATNTGTTGGALIVNGGIRVAKTSYFDTSANVFITNTDNATATIGSGSLVVSGGVSINKNVYISGTDSSNNSSSNALYVAGGIGLNGNYLVSSSSEQSFNLLTKSSKINIGSDTGTVIINSTSNPSIINTSSGIYEGGLIVNGGTRINGTATIYKLEVTNNLTLSQASTFVVGGALTVNGATNVEKLNVGGTLAVTGLNSSVNSLTVNGNLTVNGFFSYSNISFDGDLKVTTGIITTDASSASIFSTKALSLTIGRSATTINMGADLSGNTDSSLNKTIINNNLKVKGGLSIDGSLTLFAGLSANTLNVTSGQITTDSSYARIFDVSATQIDIGSKATLINIGAYLSGDTFINNKLTIQDKIEVSNGINIKNGTITSSLATASIFNTTVNNLNIGGQSINTNIGSTTGTTNIGNDLIVKNTITANKINPIVLIDDSTLFSNMPAFDYSMFGTTWNILNTNISLTAMNITSIAISATGQYLTVTDGSLNGNIYTSNNYGKTFNPVTIDISGNWKSVSMSANGKYQTAVQNIVNGKLYKSEDYGSIWTNVPIDISGNGNLKNVSISADGKYQSAITDTNIYVSSNKGDNWTSKFKIFISSNPTVITNVFTANNFVVQDINTVTSSYTALTTAIIALNIATISITPSTIATTSTIGSLQSNILTDISNINLLETTIQNKIKSSSDCNEKTSLINVYFLLETLEDGLDQLEKSNNTLIQAINGLTTTSPNDATTITNILSNNIVAARNSITPISSIPSPIISDSSSNTIQRISVSATGQYQTIVIKGGKIYTSSDYGLSWNKSTDVSGNDISGNWCSVAISATGKYQSAVQRGSSGNIYYSNNYGANWVKTTPTLDLSTGNWSSISMTSSGQYQTATYSGYNIITGGLEYGFDDGIGTMIVDYSNIFTSSDYGITWIKKAILPFEPFSVAVSSNGQYQIKYSSNSIYLSITPYPNLTISSDININNIAIGRGLGQHDNNTVVGNNALSKNTTGENNTAIGYDTLSVNDIGKANTVVGKSALSSNTSGNYNTAMGGLALTKNIAGSNNTAIGTMSMGKNTSNDNTAIGYSSLNTNITGSSNTAIGYSADVSISNLSNATAIGANAKVTNSNCLQLGDANVTKINTSGTIYSGGLNVNGKFSVDTSGNTIASNFIGDLSGNAKTANICTGNAATATKVNNTITFNNLQPYDGSSQVNVVFPTPGSDFNFGKLTVNNGINVNTEGQSAKNININYSPDWGTGLGLRDFSNDKVILIQRTGFSIAPSSNIFYVNGNGDVTAYSFNATSDYRVKENVQQLDPTLFNVDKLNPVTYNKIDSDKQDIGFIAHEVQEVFPFLVSGEKDGEQTQTLNYLGLIGVLVKEIQELKKRVAILENK